MAVVNATLMGFAVDAGAGGVTWTRTLGIQPDVNTVPITWTESSIPTTPGNLVLSDGIQNVKIDSHTDRRGKGGKYIDCVVRDRRWAWSYGHITGEYNRPDAEGKPAQDKTVRQLAALCLDAMGETGYDVSALSNTLYPHVAWDWSKPAEELQKLCEEDGTAVALLLDNTVKVVRLGTGAAWPSGARRQIYRGRRQTRNTARILA